MKKRLYLMAGNTRLMGAKVFGKDLPIKMLDYNNRFKL